MVVWIQLPGLPIHLYHKEILFTLGNLIGRAIKLDFHTLHQQRAKFARIAVEVDLSKPLIPRIRLDGQWQKVEYENLPVVCFECGKVGHTRLYCPLVARIEANNNSAGERSSPATLSTEALMDDTAGFGPWMLVTRKSRRNLRENPNYDKSEQGRQGNHGSKRKEEKMEGNYLKNQGNTSSAPSNQQRQAEERSLAGDKASTGARKVGKSDNKGKEKVGEPTQAIGKGILGPRPHSATVELATKPAKTDFSKEVEPSTTYKSTGPGSHEVTGAEYGSRPTSIPTQSIIGPQGTHIQIVQA
ncbi:unnamed protein product [Linum tenue]|uniref:CCHC-type domain-containing protein n=1 Tax=Linum tenue TaxID=586396 RepID=A0AAV0KSG9_9ROSI|nr:unnamed protein product [Linum tenue]